MKFTHTHIMTDPTAKEPAVKKGLRTPLKIKDRMGKPLYYNHLSKLIYISTLSSKVLEKNTCPYCGHVGAQTMQIEKQCADYLDLNAVNCSCRHCRREFSLGIIKSRNGEKVEFTRSYMDNMKVVDTIHHMDASTLRSHSAAMSTLSRTLDPVI